MSRSGLIVLVAAAGCRILPAPAPATPPGTDPIPEHPSELSVEDVRTWRLGDRIAASFALRGPASYHAGVGEDSYEREASYNAWLGTCRVSWTKAACRIEAGGDSEQQPMGFALSSARSGLVGSWFDDEGSLDLVEGVSGISVRDGERTIAAVALDQRPPSGWIDSNLGRMQRARIAPLLLALSALPDPRSLARSPDQPVITTATRSLAREELAEFASDEWKTLRSGPPQPAWGPDLRFSRPIFFVAELVGIGGTIPISAARVESGAPASISGRPGYSVYAGFDWADFVQLLVGVESRGVAFDADELKKVSPPGAFRVHGSLRVSLAGRLTFFRAGRIGSYLGLERVWMLSDQDSIFFQSEDIDTRSDTGYVLSAHFRGSGWAPLFAFKYKLGPVLHGGDWWSGISADIILESRYELIRWGVPDVIFQSLNTEAATVERAREAGRAWLAAYDGPRDSRHGGVRLAFQVRF